MNDPYWEKCLYNNFTFIGLDLNKNDGHVLKYNLEFPRSDARFFFGLCPVTGLPDENTSLKACSGCYSVCYSGREAQKKHWKQHKNICKALQPLGNLKSHKGPCTNHIDRILGNCDTPPPM